MSEVVIDSIDGRSLTLSDATRLDSDGNWRYTATLVTESASATTQAWEVGANLANFMRGLANALGGFDTERTHRTSDGQLSLRCVHDGRGTVTCTVTLAQPWPPTWTFTASLDLGAGAHLERIAREIEAFAPTTS